ncbi:hypothetical protein HMPREF2826_05345 [Olsenella sp. HMSC062G07]|nr:hypothetical protein HMPREF2826_05345 [Olsenella sp. HMSC062G07]
MKAEEAKANSLEALMSNPTDTLVSVLVPIYNVETYLEECLSSLRAQTYRAIEVICINDGSTDGSRDIIQSFIDQDDRFRVIDKANSGYGDSMNQGMDAATGTYISILESDDFLEPQAIEYMVKHAERDRLDMFKCAFWFYWSEPKPEYSSRHDIYCELATPDMISLGVHVARKVPGAFWKKPSIWSALYRTDFLRKNDIRFLATPGASYQDSSFTFKVLACAERVRYSGRAFLHYRQDNEHSSVNSKGKVYCTCDEHAEMSRFLREDRPDLREELDPIRAHVKFLNYSWNYDRLADEFKDEFLDRFSREMREEVDAGAIAPGVLDGSYLKDPELACFQYFMPWQVSDLREILDNKALFAARRRSRTSESKWETVRNFWAAGGPGAVATLVRLKAMGRL